MPEFIITYHGGKNPSSPEEQTKHMEKFKAWIAELGENAIYPSTPLGKVKVVSNNTVTDGDKASRMLGFSIVTANSMEEAVAITKKCPFLEMDGTLEVSEMIAMKW